MKNILIVFTLIVFFSCNSSSELSKDFNCNVSFFTNLESMKDFKKTFSISIPKSWKTNYYYDNMVSSIYTADTTVSLTKTTLIDASFVFNPIAIDASFIEKIKTDNTQMELQEIKSKKFTFTNKPAYYNLAKGKKSKYDYHILNIFVQNPTGFLHVKTEVYGDSLVNKRLCKAIKLFHKIQIE